MLFESTDPAKKAHMQMKRNISLEIRARAGRFNISHAAMCDRGTMNLDGRGSGAKNLPRV